MIYMSPQQNIDGRANVYAQILTPKSAAANPRGIWCADNQAFTQQFKEQVFMAWLEKMTPYKDTCKFVTVPDSVGNAIETQYRYRHYAWRIKAEGWPVAFVAQDGQESMTFPPEFDALFVGGSDEWKESTAADYCIRVAKERGAWIHVGRVNSIRRIRHFRLVGVDSVDGTFPTYEPDTAYRRLERALRQPPLMEL